MFPGTCWVQAKLAPGKLRGPHAASDSDVDGAAGQDELAELATELDQRRGQLADALTELDEARGKLGEHEARIRELRNESASQRVAMRFQMAGKSLRKQMLAQAQQDKSDLDQGGPPRARARLQALLPRCTRAAPRLVRASSRSLLMRLRPRLSAGWG